MTTTALKPATASAPRASRPARMLSLVRAELLLLVRNRTTLFNAVALAPLTVLLFASLGMTPDSGGSAVAGMLLTSLVALALVIVVYYNLTTTIVARREELVLKRLLTGDVSRGEIITATAAPAVLVLLAQLVLGVVAMAVWLEAPTVQNPLWVAAAVVGGVVLFVLLAAASAGLTRTVETAQLTTLPILMVATALSGLAIPLHVMPDALETVAQWTPMYPVVALVQHGLGAVALDGTVASGALADVTQPLAALALWIVLGGLATRRWMRWEPRR
ncbi:ABC-2 type transport system permease protein [Georgenia satyanarayanai]|uniref:ABC-2 type transport system permease protein n=1 Tax=Georgenia satyanarayanai TaxID=860221 RepID=A0A2Y9AUL5_9MICO|nr:ABC transporter permease [Georgenia satyanarayanai]PYF96316.1 ABC-2 type transport system permease protein [Georgenia satyanarayanai]SSA47038.1 ABC-2 type transport system permease protein [Georgenia satyanarayanai]